MNGKKLYKSCYLTPKGLNCQIDVGKINELLPEQIQQMVINNVKQRIELR
jgi:hypothetical protein